MGEHTGDEVVAALKAAKENGAYTSYDLNYRSTLWDIEEARKVAEAAMPYVDVLFGIEAGAVLGIHNEEGEDNYFSEDPEDYRKLAQKIMQKYPNLMAMGASLRQVKTACINDWQTCMLTRNGFFLSPKYENVEIQDRIGSGDSFAAAIIWGFLEGHEEQEIIDFAGAYSALSHTVRNDWNLVSREEAYALARGGSARVKR